MDDELLQQFRQFDIIRGLEFTDIPFIFLSCPNYSVGHPALKHGFPPKTRGNDRVVRCGILVIAESLSRMNKMMVGREIRMHEIKEENEKLKAKIEELEKGVTGND